jgi:SEFIR domain
MGTRPCGSTQRERCRCNIDKWDLKEGHDAIKFMEKMVTDPEIKKVIVVLDRTYAEKADGREGGVGTETQIISPKIYAKADQNKFVGVASEQATTESHSSPRSTNQESISI